MLLPSAVGLLKWRANGAGTALTQCCASVLSQLSQQKRTHTHSTSVQHAHLSAAESCSQSLPVPAARPTSVLSRLTEGMSRRAATAQRTAYLAWRVDQVATPSILLSRQRTYGTLVAFPLAQTGEGISECELIQWFVAEGDTVQEFDKLAEVQSDKASIEITSRYSGTVRKLHHSKGDLVKVGAALVDIEVAGDLPQGATPAAVELPEAAAAAASVAATVVAASSTSSGTITAAAGLPCSPAAASKPVESAVTGAAAVVSLSSSQTPSQVVHAAAAAKASMAGATSFPVAPVMGASDTSAVLTSPAVRRLARESGVDLSLVRGTGDKGRITREDVVRHLEAAGSAPVAAAATTAHAAQMQATGRGAAAPPPPQPCVQIPALPAPLPGTVTRLPVRGYRRAMVKSMTAAAAVPHFHFHDEMSMDALMAARRALGGHPALGGVKLTLLPFIIKALSITLSQHPLLNASLSPDGNELILHGSHNIGVAMATSHGLVVPVVKGVQGLSVVQVAHEVARLQAAAATNKLVPEDLTAATISVSNIGTIGGLFANPLVNPPEAVIVALGRVRTVPTVLGGEHGGGKGGASGTPVVSAHAVMGVSWGADHRVVDGAGLAHASNAWKALLENPHAMLLHMR